MKLNIKQATLFLGLLFGLWHLVWVILVGVSENVINYVAKMHFVSGLSALPFNFLTALLGVILAFVAGCIVGAVSAWIWNKLEK